MRENNADNKMSKINNRINKKLINKQNSQNRNANNYRNNCRKINKIKSTLSRNIR